LGIDWLWVTDTKEMNTTANNSLLIILKNTEKYGSIEFRKVKTG
jgi:hypothetical protein